MDVGRWNGSRQNDTPGHDEPDAWYEPSHDGHVWDEFHESSQESEKKCENMTKKERK